MGAVSLDPFLDCDIRGVYGHEITELFARDLGLAVGSVAGRGPVVVAGDYRTHTPVLMAALCDGLRQAGADVVSCGQIPTPVYYHARHDLGIDAGIMVTASHNPPEYAGFKPILGHLPITPGQIDDLRHRMGHRPAPGMVSGGLRMHDALPSYEESIRQMARGLLSESAAGLRVVVDCGSGCFGPTAPPVLRALGFDVVERFTEPDGTFPHRPSNVALREALEPCIGAVRETGSAFGVAYDGDGDRIAVIDDQGSPVPNDVLVALLAGDALDRHPGGAVVYDVKCSAIVREAVQRAGGVPVVQKSGHTYIKTAMIERHAAFGGEASGHLFYHELHGGDDALYSTLRVAALVLRSGKPLSALSAAVPRYATTPDLRIGCEGDRGAVIRAIREALRAQTDVRLSDVDGVRADFAEGWGLARVSVTEPVITLRFEAREPGDLRPLMERFLAGAPAGLRQAVFEATAVGDGCQPDEGGRNDAAHR